MSSVPSQHNGIEIQCRHSCGLGQDCGLDLIPGVGAPYAEGWPKMKKRGGMRVRRAYEKKFLPVMCNHTDGGNMCIVILSLSCIQCGIM